MRAFKPLLVVLTLGLVAVFTLDSGKADSPATAPIAHSSMTATPATPAEAATPESAKPISIAHGERVNLEEYLVPGQITLFDFTSAYCGPCRQFAPYLEKLHLERDDMTVVKVDINRPNRRGIDWRSPVAMQYGVRSVPHFKVYDPEGKLISEGRQARPLVVRWIQELPSFRTN